MLKKQSTSVLGSKPQHLKTKRQTQIQKRMDIIMTSGDNFVFVFLREREKAHACEQGGVGWGRVWNPKEAPHSAPSQTPRS